MLSEQGGEAWRAEDNNAIDGTTRAFGSIQVTTVAADL